jgi:hypothetical protein
MIEKELTLLEGKFSVCKLTPNEPFPIPPSPTDLWSLSITPNEISLVCPESDAPDFAKVEAGWRVLMVKGQLDFSLTGILAELSGLLANAGIPIFVISTFDTDYLLLKEEMIEKAQQTLKNEWTISF